MSDKSTPDPCKKCNEKPVNQKPWLPANLCEACAHQLEELADRAGLYLR